MTDENISFDSGLFIERISLTKAIPQSSYLNKVPAIRHLQDQKRIDITSPVTVFVGENGIGKSTLIEGIAVACGFNAEGGTKNYAFATSETHSELFRLLTVSRRHREKDGFFLRAESFYNAASYLEELDSIECAAPPVLLSYGGRSLHCRSHGESFLALAENRFGGNSLYILDEPEAALSPTGQMRLLARMRELEKNNSQFIISTHSPIIMSYPNADVLEITDKGINRVDWRQTGHYAITKRFLDAPEKMFEELFGE